MKRIRNTPQRKLIAGILENSHAHPTAEEIYALARQEDARISRGTVYRNLHFLVKEGLVCRLAAPDGPDHYDCVRQAHYHFFCRRCHGVTDTGLPYHQAFNNAPADLFGYRIERHQLLLIGLCPNCRD